MLGRSNPPGQSSADGLRYFSRCLEEKFVCLLKILNKQSFILWDSLCFDMNNGKLDGTLTARSRK